MSDVANSLEKHWTLLPSSRAVEANSGRIVKGEGLVLWNHADDKAPGGASGLLCAAARPGLASPL